MATHDVKVTFPKEELIAELGNRDMKFTIKRNGQAFGRLMISKGAVEWKAKHEKRATKLSWTEFADRLNGQ